MPTPTVFISYRRKSSVDLARLIHARLATAGVDVFFDLDALEAGEQYEPRLERELIERDVLVVILAPDTLERSAWVPREIATALRHNKKIIPVTTGGYTFSRGTLPPEIGDLNRFTYVPYESHFADAVFEKIETALGINTTVAHPGQTGQRAGMSDNVKIALIGGIVTLIAAIITGVFGLLPTLLNASAATNVPTALVGSVVSTTNNGVPTNTLWPSETNLPPSDIPVLTFTSVTTVPTSALIFPTYPSPATLTDAPTITPFNRQTEDAATFIALTLINEQILSLTPPTSTTAPSPTPLPTATPIVITINTNGVNLRGGPGTGYPVVGKTIKKQKFTVIAQFVNSNREKWYMVVLPDGQKPAIDDAWILSLFIEPQFDDTSVPTPIAIPTLDPQQVLSYPPIDSVCPHESWFEGGCGANNCPYDSVSKCNDTGTGYICVWDPGECSSQVVVGFPPHPPKGDGGNDGGNTSWCSQTLINTGLAELAASKGISVAELIQQLLPMYDVHPKDGQITCSDLEYLYPSGPP